MKYKEIKINTLPVFINTSCVTQNGLRWEHSRNICTYSLHILTFLKGSRRTFTVSWRLLLRTPGPVPFWLAYVLHVETNLISELIMVVRTLSLEHSTVYVLSFLLQTLFGLIISIPQMYVQEDETSCFLRSTSFPKEMWQTYTTRHIFSIGWRETTRSKWRKQSPQYIMHLNWRKHNRYPELEG